MNIIEWMHGRHIASRRARVIAHRIAEILPKDAAVLDVGCGDGEVASLIMAERSDVQIRGVDVLVRPKTMVPVTHFDGSHLPFEDRAFDVVLFVDVLHHVDDATVLLKEARRVAAESLIIKDHLCDGFLAWPTLRFMDEVGNRRYGVALPHHYLRSQQWRDASTALQTSIAFWSEKLHLYPWPLGLLFDRSLHVLMRWDIGV